MNFELVGNLIVKDEEQQISASFKKREFVIEVVNERNSDWNDFIKFQLTQERCSELEGKNLGDEVKVNFNVRGRKWEKDGKINYFSNLEAWKIEKLSGTMQQSAPPNNAPPAGENDDLPF